MSILRIPTVKNELGHKSNTSIYSAIRGGLLTRAVPLSKRAVGWPEAEIQAISAARIAGNSEEQIRDLVRGCTEFCVNGAGISPLASCLRTEW
jgi:prophage regulatory protein